MVDYVKFNGGVAFVIIDDSVDNVRFIDKSHVLYQIPRDDLDVVVDGGIFFYHILPNKEPIVVYHHDELVEMTKKMIPYRPSD